MEQSIRDQFNENILTEALQYYDVTRDQAQMLGGFKSYIFEINTPEEEFILRIGHNSRRSPDLVQGESEFLNHLSSGELSVPRVPSSLNHRQVECIPARDGQPFSHHTVLKSAGASARQTRMAAASFSGHGTCFAS